MAATTAEIRAGFAATIKTGVGRAWQVSPYMLVPPKPPSIDVYPAAITFDSAMDRGGDQLDYIVRAIVAIGEGKAPQIKLDRLLDTSEATGMKAILETDCTLGGTVADLRVVDMQGYRGLIIDGQPPMVGVEFTVTVLGLP